MRTCTAGLPACLSCAILIGSEKEYCLFDTWLARWRWCESAYHGHTLRLVVYWHLPLRAVEDYLRQHAKRRIRYALEESVCFVVCPLRGNRGHIYKIVANSRHVFISL
jgi:hypothetical protein